MSYRITPPTLPIRSADDYSQYLAKGLLLGYPLIGGGSVIKNFGSWGSDGDLDLVNVTKTRRDGLASVSFDGASSVASNTLLNRSLPERWSIAYWLKMDSVPVSGEKTIFSLGGSTGPSMRVWADSQGVWCWQKHSIADSYSILPVSDFPSSNTMLIIGVFDGSYLAPAQLRTNQGMTSLPVQPSSYTSFNAGAGIQATEVTSITLGNADDLSSPFNGTLGPLYFWNRALSESEIWQLSQDPYAPFRRNTSQYLIPSTMNATGGFNLQGVGKSTDVSPIISDDSALFIVHNEYVSYSNMPDDFVVSDNRDIDLVLTVNDTLSYRAIPTDTLDTDAPYSLYVLNVVDTIPYSTLPDDSFISPESGSSIVPIINVVEAMPYSNIPTDSVSGGSEAPTTIYLSENINYRNTPNETMTTT